MNLRNESGQAAALTAIFMTVLLASCAAVLDVGSWFREDRDTQRIADAAALAGAQELAQGNGTGAARSRALEYAGKNGGGISAGDVSFSSQAMADDTIHTQIQREAPGFFAKVFGIDSVTVGSRASARVGVPVAMQYVAPIVVNEMHPNLVNARYGEENETTIVLERQHRRGSGDAAGAFGLLNLDQGSSGAPGASTIAQWMRKGFDEYMGRGRYRSAPSALFNSNDMGEALTLRTGTIVMFPVCEARGNDNSCSIQSGGQNAEYTIIGWIAFYITGFENRGVQSSVEGYFVDGVIWPGVLTNGSTTPDFGVRTIALID